MRLWLGYRPFPTVPTICCVDPSIEIALSPTSLNEHLRTVDMEVKRERTVTQSVQEDNAMLREQLGTANERIRGLEKVRKDGEWGS